MKVSCKNSISIGSNNPHIGMINLKTNSFLSPAPRFDKVNDEA